MEKSEGNWLQDSLSVILVVLLVLPLALSVIHERSDRQDERSEAYVLVKPGVVTAQWGYKQLAMEKCAWCNRTVDMNRHHIVPQSANPALRDVKENLIVLCRDCHFVLGHRCNWKQYNPDVLYICTHYTNCIQSSDTRRQTEAPDTKKARSPAVIPDTTPILHVTNDVPQKQRSALERILKWKPEGTNSLGFRPSSVR